METSSQFHDGAIKFYPHLAQRYYTLLDWVEETFVKGLGLLFTVLNNNGNLNVQFNYFFRLTLSQYGKAFSLSATPFAY